MFLITWTITKLAAMGQFGKGENSRKMEEELFCHV